MKTHRHPFNNVGVTCEGCQEICLVYFYWGGGVISEGGYGWMLGVRMKGLRDGYLCKGQGVNGSGYGCL